MKRKVVTALVVGTILAVSFTVLAAPSAEQTKKIEAVQAKIAAAHKEMINTQAEAGLITKEQAQRMIEQIDAREAQRKPLTEEQQKTLAAAYAKQVALAKEMVTARQEAGLLTKEQANAAIKQIEAQAAYQEKMGFDNYRGSLGRGGRGGRGGNMNGDCPGMSGRGGMMNGSQGGMMGGMMNSPQGGMMNGMMNGPQGGMMGGFQGGQFKK